MSPTTRHRTGIVAASCLGLALIPALTTGAATSAARKASAPAAPSRARGPLTAAQAPRPAGTKPLDFNRDVRPILSDNCFACHGPDQAKRAAGLRLDLREEAIARGAIVPGKPEKSRMLARVLAREPGRLMPPVSSHLRLSPEQKQVLQRWVAEGAKYAVHWSFAPLPARVPVPAVRDQSWSRNEIDRFVLARLEQEGLKPSVPATRGTWLRRVTFDLTGLPPTLSEIDAFEADRSPAAFEKVVDRLLASPRFGEAMAVPWLDAARYGDSYGYQSDQLSPTWPYRDWVVRAFNSDLPYDQFITWQVAGDLLPNPTRDQRLATAFNRLHRMTNEGGSVPEEWRLEGVADRVHTFSTAFLGLTFECARCHDHKYDPISHRDYYSLSAFFNSIDEHGMYDRADIVPSPSMLLPTPEQEQQLESAREALARAEQAYKEAQTQAEPRFRQWLARLTPEAGTSVPEVPMETDLTGKFGFEKFDGAALKNEASGATQHGARLDEVPLVKGRQGKAIQLDGENNVNFPALGKFSRHTPYTIAFWMNDPRIAAEPAVVYQACSGTDAGPHGYDLMLEKGRLTARMFRHWPGNAIAVRTRTPIPVNAWQHVAVTYDGSSRAAGLKIYVNGSLAEMEVVRDKMVKGTGQHTLIFGQRFRDKGFKGGLIDELRIFERAISRWEVKRLSLEQPSGFRLPTGDEERASMREYYLSAIDPEVRKAFAALTTSRAAVVAAEDAQFEVAVMEEMPHPRPAHVLDRGRYDAPRTDANRVERSTPTAVLAFPKDLPRNRLGLAKWLTHPKNPLTARVAVNRVWSQLFGKGLVDTAENFGLQGKLPSHPELLDYLASAFSGEAGGQAVRAGDVARPRPARDAAASRHATRPTQYASNASTHGLGWSTKKLIKLIVLSATYRQASALRPDLLKRDPQNILLARGPSHRLSAEQVRDMALATSGLLDERAGGPPVSPYQPGDLWREANTMSPPYRQSVGRDLYRRTLYSVWKRTAPLPNLLVFDAVSREVCVARRQTTNTPLQALVLLNDPQFVEAARLLAERMLKEGGKDASGKIRFVFRTLTAREPTYRELELLGALHAAQVAHFTANPADAPKLLLIGERKADAALSPVELAAATVVVQAVLNMDATIWKR